LHREAFALAQQLAVPATCHAGEWNENYKTFENIELALELGCRRIGHGLTLRQALKDESKAAILEQIR
jgi:adenosine deaminase